MEHHAEGRRRLPQHAVQRRAAKRAPKLCPRAGRAACGTFASNCWKICRRPKSLESIDLYRGLLAGELEAATGVDRAAGGQPGRRHPRHAGRAPQSAGDPLMPRRTGFKACWEKGTVPNLLRRLRKFGTVPTGFETASARRPHIAADAGNHQSRQDQRAGRAVQAHWPRVGSRAWQIEALTPADLPEVEETGTTAAENAAIKATAYARACGDVDLGR